MLVVDRSIFAQLQADHTGVDFMELSANLIRAQRYQNGSNPSIFDSEATSKGLSPTSMDFLPPAYEDIFGTKNSDLPPSYSEISMMLRKLSDENCSVASGGERCTKVIVKGNNCGVVSREINFNALRTSSSAPFALNARETAFGRQLKEFCSLEDSIERHGPQDEEGQSDGDAATDEAQNGDGDPPPSIVIENLEFVDRESSV